MAEGAASAANASASPAVTAVFTVLQSAMPSPERVAGDAAILGPAPGSVKRASRLLPR
jgi:hypothetical protein